jgi:hypothetical protein
MGEVEGQTPQSADRCRYAGRATGTLRRLALAVTAILAIIGVSAAPSFAARGHEFAGAFGWGVLNGASELQRCESKELPTVPPSCQQGLSGNGPGQFGDPAAVAVNEATGNVYVVDKANNRVEIFNASGTKFEGGFNGSGLLPNEGKAAGSGGLEEEVATGQFDEPEGIAVDNSCVLRHLSEPKCKEEDPSNGDVYVVDTNGHKGGTFEEERMVIDKFDPSGKYIGQITRNPNGQPFSEEGFRELFGVAVDRRGEVWVEGHNFGPLQNGAANYTNALTNAWIAFRSTENQQSALPAPGFAVDSEDNLYVHNTFPGIDRIAKFTADGELITAEVDEEAPTGVAVELSSDDVYVSHASNVHRLSSSLASLEALDKAPGAPSFGGVAANSATLNVYVADPPENRVEVFAPEAPGIPTVATGGESVSDVTATSASFAAEVNPRSEENEGATSYSFQYGPCDTPSTCSTSPYTQSTPVPQGVLAPNYEPDLIAAHPQNLAPHTVYHMRVAAHNSHGEAQGVEELIFTTQGPGASPSPDGRQWELVSPPDKHGAIIFPIKGSGVIQAAANGGAISYLTNAPSESQPAGFSQAVQILSRRGSSSWLSQDIATPHETAAGISITSEGEYRFFAEDLSGAVVQPFGPFTQATSPQASEQTLYLRANFPPGDPSHPCNSSCYRPLVSGCPGEGEPCPGPIEEVANVPEGTKFGTENGRPIFLGASPDASHVVLGSPAKLTEDAPAEGEAGSGSLYEWSGGQLAVVSVLPNGSPAPASTRPALGFIGGNANTRIARHAVSAGGGRVVWSAGELDGSKQPTGNHHLYLRDTLSEQTIELDAPEAACTAEGKCKGGAQPIFQTASADGSRIFFTDSQPLTLASGNSDLYECEIEEAEEEPPTCKLSDLTSPGSGEAGAGVLGLVAGASEDGTVLYFTANGRLATEPSARGDEAVAGDCKGNTERVAFESETAPQRCNLYARTGGQTRLVAVLSGADFPDWSLRETGLRGLTARVSPDGRRLAFMSRRSLSGYDNRDALSGKPDEEVFLYNSAVGGGQGALSCASCDPSGGRPRGVQYSRIDTDETGLAGGSRIWPQGVWIAASVPGWTAINEAQGLALHQSRYLANSGRLFFNSADALVPQDANKSEDVYQYEPPGVGDCNGEKATFSPASGGCVALISSGTAKQESAFLDASESGDDVFFLTGERLLPSQDVDRSLDVYDAHACSGAAPCLPEAPTPPLACEGDACQSPGGPPEDQTPGSLTYQGPGNPTPPPAPLIKHKSAAELKAEKLKQALKSCRKQKRKRKRSACEAKARKLYGPHKAKKSKKSSRKKR